MGQVKLDDFQNASASFRRRNPQVAGAGSLVLEPKPGRGVEKERKLHDRIWAECHRRGWIVVHSRTDRVSTVAVGTADFIILADSCRTFAVEVKTGRGKLRTEQRAWMAWAHKLGHRAGLVHSMEEFFEFIGK